jgi:hypothetical protein
VNYPSIIAVIASLITLLLGFQSWRLTSSKSVFMNTLVGSGGLLLAAYLCAAPTRAEAAFVIPFLIAMLFAGWGLAVLWRSRREPPLGLPSTLMLTIAAAALFASFAAYSS